MTSGLNKKILVTGANGFIGSHLINELARTGNTVIGIDLHHTKDRHSCTPHNIKEVSGDFRNIDLIRALLKDVDVVFHLASAHLQISLPESEYWEINVHSLRRFMMLAYQSGVKRFVHISSTGVYGNLETWPANEETPCRPQNIYGETKMAGETEVKKYYEDTNFPIVILRPSWVYGPGCPRTMKIYRTLRNGHFVMIGSGNNLRHPVYIKDILSAFILAMKSESAVGETIIIGGNQTMTTAEVIESFCKVMDLSKPKKLPLYLGKIIASIFEIAFSLAGKEPPISKRSLEFFQTNNSFNINKAKRLLGFQPSFSFEEGLKESKTWLERNA